MMFYDVLWCSMISMIFYDILWCFMMFYDVLCLKSIFGFLLSEHTFGVSPVIFFDIMMMLNYPEARMTVPFSAITRIGGEFVLKQKSFIIIPFHPTSPTFIAFGATSVYDGIIVVFKISTYDDSEVPLVYQHAGRREGLNFSIKIIYIFLYWESFFVYYFD